MPIPFILAVGLYCVVGKKLNYLDLDKAPLTRKMLMHIDVTIATKWPCIKRKKSYV